MNVKNYSTKFLSRGNEAIDGYLKDIRKFPVMTIEEERETFAIYNNKELDKKVRMDARDKIILANQRFIVSLAKRYAKSDNLVPDYISEGNIGIIKAIDAYKPEEYGNVKFITYAVWYIRREMNRFLNDKINIINRSNNMKLMGKIDKVKEKFYSENGYAPSDQIVADMIKEIYDIEIKDLADVADINVSSINEEVSEDFTVEEDSDFNEETASVNDYERIVDKDDVNKHYNECMALLPANIAEIIKKNFGIGYLRKYEISELAEEYNMKPSEIKNIIKSAFVYIRQEHKVA